jgi:hypothetical protein
VLAQCMRHIGHIGNEPQLKFTAQPPEVLKRLNLA